MAYMVRRISHNAPEVAKAVGQAMRAHRKARKLTQEAVAHQAEVDRTYLQQIEKGMFQPTIAVFIDVAQALGVKPDALLTEILKELARARAT